MNHKSFTLFSWNVRGLGQSGRCEDVLSDLISTRPNFAALQETKLSHISVGKRNSFLPKRLSSFAAKNSVGTSGGILTAWDDALCTLDDSAQGEFTLTTRFSLRADGCSFTLTNVYAPANREDKPAFAAELTSVAATVSGPWILIGDFNLTRAPEDKNNPSFNAQEASL